MTRRNEDNDVKIKIIEIGRKLYERGFVSATDGNLSVRMNNGMILITQSGICKGELTSEDIVTIDGSGNVVHGHGRPSVELRMHLIMYTIRPDIQAVVHAHPPVLTAFTLAGVAFNSAWFPEVWVSVGTVPIAAYAPPSSNELSESLRPYIARHNAILLERHGSVTVGKNLDEAYFRLEKLEHAAKTALYTHILAGTLPEPLSPEMCAELEHIFNIQPSE